MKNRFDVLVAGGGPAGSAAALDLSRRGFSVALIEQDNYETPRVGETLPPMIRHPLTTLGVWERFRECQPLESYGIRAAWETPEPRDHDFLRNPYGTGWHVDRARFDAMLASAAADAGAELFLSARASACRKEPGGRWHLEVAQGTRTLAFTGRILVDATGRKALLATPQGSQAHVTDRLIGAATFSKTAAIDQCTLIEATEDGWWYSAPLPEARMVFAYMTDADLWRNPAWGDLVERAPLTFERAGCLPIPPPFQVVSAASVVHRPVTGPGWIAIGDAALAFDPLSGQGIHKSLETASRASAAITGYLDGDSNALEEYEGWAALTYQSYLTQRSRFYSSVRRWPGSPFWRRRAA